jgi:hypothetical protein
MKRALVVSLALLPTVAGADQVFTRSGGQLNGEIVERRADSIVVDIGGGTIELPVSYIERIVPGPSPLASYRQKAERVAPDDAAGWVDLGQWARQQDLPTQASEAFLRAVSLDPDNATARQALGHVKVRGEWMSREEGYRERGLVAFEGRWMTPDEREALVAERTAAAEQVQAEAEMLARVRESEARAREAEAQARLAEAAARIAEVDAVRAESPSSSIQWVPAGLDLRPLASTRFRRGFLRGCHWPAWSAVKPHGAVHLAGRGGAFVVSGGLRPVGRR